jgi:ankyrin repeat protein
MWNHSEIVRMLIDAGADLNIQSYNGWTALHCCARNNRPEILRMLIDAGADKTIPTNDGKLPYELATISGLKKLLQP